MITFLHSLIISKEQRLVVVALSMTLEALGLLTMNKQKPCLRRWGSGLGQNMIQQHTPALGLRLKQLLVDAQSLPR